MARNSRRRKPPIQRNPRNPRNPQIPPRNKKPPVVGTFLGEEEIYDIFVKDYRTGIKVRDVKGKIKPLYPNGDLMDQVSNSGVKIGDKVFIDVVESIQTGNGHFFDHYEVHVI